MAAPGAPDDGSPAWDDAVGRADAVRANLTRLLDELVGALSPDADPGKVYVGWFDAADVAGCPVRYRAGGAEGWGFPGWSPQNAGGAVGRAALARYLDRHVTAAGAAQGTVAPLPCPLEAVKTWMREARETPTSSIAEWVTKLSRTGEKADLAATAGLATRWIAGFVRVLGWPLPDGLAVVVDDPGSPSARRSTPAWRPRLASRRVGISIGSKPDAVVGTVAPSGRFDVLFHRPTSGDDLALTERAAFEAAAAAAAIGIVPRAVVITTADSGERLRFPVRDELLRCGADMAVEVVRQRLRACEPLPDGVAEHDDAAPSAACRYCPERAACPPGKAWLERPGRWHHGLPVLAG